MGRPVRIRDTFTGDRSRLTRLEEAVERDPRLSSEERAELVGLIRQLLAKLIGLDAKLGNVSKFKR